jgi:hypothetical protein
MKHVTIRDNNATVLATGSCRDTTGKMQCVLNVAHRSKLTNYPDIGTWQHFEGGETYHVQFGKYLPKCNATTLTDRYIVRIEE